MDTTAMFTTVILFAVIGWAGARFQAPPQCRWEYSTPDEISVVCRLHTLQTDSDHTNLSTIQTEGTVSLRILCADGIFVQSQFTNNSLDHLVYLRSLQIEHCKLSQLPSDAFSGLRELRNLSIRTHNEEWAILSLELHSRSFNELRQLERLDLGYNSLWSLPKRTFCPLKSMKSLNLTANKLQEVLALGFSAETTDCQLALDSLDLSANRLQILPDNGFVALKRVTELNLAGNEISLVSGRALAGLSLLKVLNLARNKLVALPPELLHNCSQVQDLNLSNNTITILPPSFLKGLQQLLVLDLSANALTNQWVNAELFQDAIRLVILNLSSNKLTRIDSSAFHNLYSLQILRLENNEIDYISENAFASMYNMHTLVLSQNKLKHVDSFMFNGLFVLSLLSLDNNELGSVDPEAFRNCSNLQDLNLNGNRFTRVPDAIRVLQFLKTIDLGENQITTLQNASFRGLQQLHGLRLLDNQIMNITKFTFENMPALKILNMAKNKIQFIEHGSFYNNLELQAIRLDSNSLADINGLFSNLPNLIWLNISANQITWFDYSLIPVGLQWLDIHSNHISNLGNYFEIEGKLKLQTMDASYNKIAEISGSSLPDGIQLLFLNDNQLATVHPYTFFKKHNITRVDLFGNSIQNMDLNALRLNPVPDNKPIPEFYIGGNPFQCDCEMEWLQRINNLDTLRQHPKVMDLDSIYCKLLYNNYDKTYIPLVEATSAQFLCPYQTHCFALCHCCDFDACDCEMTCPDNCTCYHDQSWSANIVVCTQRGYTKMPDRIPMDATQVYLDGNDIKSLSAHTFIGRKNMRILYLNNSAISIINNRTFNGLRALVILHLENNILPELKGYEFERLENLKELYLHNNRISFVYNNTFMPLKSLEILRIDGNFIHHFKVWTFDINPVLYSLSLANNPWLCECNFLEDYHTWLVSFGSRLVDADHIKCYFNDSVTPGPLIREFNSSMCENNATYTTIIQPRVMDDYLPMLVAIGCAVLAFAVVIIVIFLFRSDIRVCMYSKYGLRMCAKEEKDCEESKLFDAFVSYSSKDENFVLQMLAPELECGTPAYRLCLHYRDFPVGAYVSDTIVEAVESSSYTILVLSENFIKSEWCRFEFKSAHHQVLKDRRKRLIVIVLGEVAQRDLDPDIRLYLKTNTYLRWGEKHFWEKLRYALPDVSRRQQQQQQMQFMQPPQLTHQQHLHQLHQQQLHQQLMQQTLQHRHLYHEVVHHPGTLMRGGSVGGGGVNCEENFYHDVRNVDCGNSASRSVAIHI